MADLLTRLKQRKLVQWALAYLAAAWVLLQVIDLASGSFGWPKAVMHVAFGVLAVGFVVTVILAWYHGERGAQRISGPELLLIALVLAVGGGLLWHFARVPATNVVARAAASTRGSNTALPSATVPQVASPAAAQPIPAKSVAVLPFENLSTDKGNAYFADGMQDLILTKLADIGDLKVISRTSTMKYASHPDDLKTVGRQLGVATILEGSVQKAGKQVLINVQLIDARTDSHIWAQSYQRTLDNIFGVEGEVAGKVADALKAKLTQGETARINTIPTENQAAYNAYLQGEYYRSHTDLTDNLEKAAGYYRKAVAQDPKFVLAWARLSYVLSSRATDPQLSENVEQALAAGVQAKAALDRALALAPNSPDVQLAKGWYLAFVKMDQADARSAFESVLAAQPNNAQAVRALGTVESYQGAWRNALENFETASTLAPRNPEVLDSLWFAQMELRDYPDAARTAKRWVAIDPAGESATTRLMDAYQSMGDFSAAEAALAAAPASLRDSPDMILRLAQLKMLQRDFNGARQLLASLKPSASLEPGLITYYRGLNELQAGNAPQAHHYFAQTLTLYNANAGEHTGTEGNHILRGLMYAGMGRAADALRQLQLAQHESATYQSPNPFQRKVAALFISAQIEAMLGNADAATKALDQLLTMPAGFAVSVPLLKLSPMWDPIRHDPRFQALLKKYASAQPATTGTSATSSTQ